MRPPSVLIERGVVVLGAQGMLGRALSVLLDARGLSFPEVDRDELDLADAGAVAKSKLPMDAIWFNCAAWTNVDGAETHEADALAVNGGEGLATLCARLRDAGGTLVHVSTDYVFDGKATTPYRIDHPRNPVGAYGRTKAAGERAIEASGCEHLIARTSWLYAPWANNFVRTMAKLTRDKSELKVVSDQRGRPTSSEHVARSLVALVEAEARGTFHVTDGGECSWFELACAVRDGLGHTCDIRPCTTAEFPRPAPRPAYSVLDLTRTEALLGKMPDWRANLAEVLKRLEPLG